MYWYTEEESNPDTAEYEEQIAMLEAEEMEEEEEEEEEEEDMDARQRMKDALVEQYEEENEAVNSLQVRMSLEYLVLYYINSHMPEVTTGIRKKKNRNYYENEHYSSFYKYLCLL